MLAAAVDVDTMAAVAPNDRGLIRLWSAGFPPCQIHVDPAQNAPAHRESALSLLQGMAALCASLGTPCGLDIRASSTVLPGGGLSSSASFEVLLLVEKLDLDLEAAGYALFIINCGASHADLTGEYAAIPQELRALCACFGKQVLAEVPEAAFFARLPELRAACGDRAVLRALHVYAENRRVPAMRDALKAGDFDRYLGLVRESGLSSWRFLQNVTPAGQTAEQPMALTLALCEKLLAGRGACRVHGGGFAGTAQAYVPLDQAEEFRAAMEDVLGEGACQRRTVRAVGAAEILL